MPQDRDYITEPNEQQALAWEDFNAALGALATAYAVNPDDLNEMAGRATEEVIRHLMPKEAA